MDIFAPKLKERGFALSFCFDSLKWRFAAKSLFVSLFV